ncbi:MAG: fucose isomerase, partial [Candidatus Heimdallarchaeota archaeon]|nr:fucose isomerase [Candidatus Heimdallarchaeota archaeon]
TDYWVSTGTILRNIENESACRTQLEIKLDKPVEYFLKNSLANHHIMVLGDHEKEIKMFFDLFAN